MFFQRHLLAALRFSVENNIVTAEPISDEEFHSSFRLVVLYFTIVFINASGLMASSFLAFLFQNHPTCHINFSLLMSNLFGILSYHTLMQLIQFSIVLFSHTTSIDLDADVDCKAINLSISSGVTTGILVIIGAIIFERLYATINFQNYEFSDFSMYIKYASKIFWTGVFLITVWNFFIAGESLSSSSYLTCIVKSAKISPIVKIIPAIFITTGFFVYFVLLGCLLQCNLERQQLLKAPGGDYSLGLCYQVRENERSLRLVLWFCFTFALMLGGYMYESHSTFTEIFDSHDKLSPEYIIFWTDFNRLFIAAISIVVPIVVIYRSKNLSAKVYQRFSDFRRRYDMYLRLRGGNPIESKSLL